MSAGTPEFHCHAGGGYEFRAPCADSGLPQGADSSSGLAAPYAGEGFKISIDAPSQAFGKALPDEFNLLFCGWLHEPARWPAPEQPQRSNSTPGPLIGGKHHRLASRTDADNPLSGQQWPHRYRQGVRLLAEQYRINEDSRWRARVFPISTPEPVPRPASEAPRISEHPSPAPARAGRFSRCSCDFAVSWRSAQLAPDGVERDLRRLRCIAPGSTPKACRRLSRFGEAMSPSASWFAREAPRTLAMMAIASAREGSIRTGVWVIGIVTIVPEMDGDGGKYILCHFGNMSM